MPEEYDVQQVCENGHQITDCYNIKPERRKEFCQECGAATRTTCPNCNKEIQGAQLRVSKSLNDARQHGAKEEPTASPDDTEPTKSLQPGSRNTGSGNWND